MQEEGRTHAQYIFLDVVKFTQGRSVEAQVEIVHSLTAMVREALEEHELTEPGRIILPTGDGMAIAILRAEPLELALEVASYILARVQRHSEATSDQRRRFSVRVGVNQNVDNVVIDINGNRNIAGRGINMAQRIMSLADGNQILAGESVYEFLCEREAYYDAFKRFHAADKHGAQFRVYQLIKSDAEGLNIATPSAFRSPEALPLQMSVYIAHFIANAEHHREFLLTHRDEPGFDYTASVFLHLSALDSIDDMARNPLGKRHSRITISPGESALSSYTAIDKSEFWTRAELATAIADKLQQGSMWFESDQASYTTLWAFPTEAAKSLVQQTHPEVWAAVVRGDSRQDDKTVEIK